MVIFPLLFVTVRTGHYEPGCVFTKKVKCQGGGQPLSTVSQRSSLGKENGSIVFYLSMVSTAFIKTVTYKNLYIGCSHVGSDKPWMSGEPYLAIAAQAPPTITLHCPQIRSGVSLRGSLLRSPDEATANYMKYWFSLRSPYLRICKGTLCAHCKKLVLWEWCPSSFHLHC